ncbi:uncharacterized protein LOC17894334 [Capsella rubella]|uniref:uncharacterized protein LOC17894334 n=1 Tax=Capsella rubella TaxID=81985 RepID=UPI000CD5B190|nr:uncharacterized protein LOC17894334 [Capsella rubella]
MNWRLKTCSLKTCSTSSTDVKSLHDVNKEIKKLRKSCEKLTETFEKLQEIILNGRNLPVVSFKEKEAPEIKVQPTLLVKGFDESLPRDEIKTALWKHFSTCGKVTDVHVPINFKTGAPLRYACILLEDHTKGFALRGSLLRGRELQVYMINNSDQFGWFRNLTIYRPYKPSFAVRDDLICDIRRKIRLREAQKKLRKAGKLSSKQLRISPL